MTKNFVIADSEQFRESIFTAIDSSEYIAFDIETTGLNPRKEQVIGYAICTEIGTAYYIPRLEWSGDRLIEVETASRLYTDVLIALQGKKLLMHNGAFDTKFIWENHEINLIDSLHADTMLLKHTIDENHPFGLKDIAKQIQDQIGLDVSVEANAEQLELKEHLKSKGASMTKESYELFKGDTAIIGKYACADVDLTYRVFTYYEQKLREQRLSDFFYKDEVMPLYREVTIPMELRGVPFDASTCSRLREELGYDLEQLERKILKQVDPELDLFKTWFLNKEYPATRTGVFVQAAVDYFQISLPRTKAGRYSLSKKHIDALPDSHFKKWFNKEIRLSPQEISEIQAIAHQDQPMFNISSKDHLKRLFFTKLKLTPKSKTAKGNPQVDDTFLRSIVKTHPWVKDLLLYNRLSKLKGSYYDRFHDQQENGIFYPSFNQHRTVSGRYGSDIQQLPRPVSSGNKLIQRYQNAIRKLFISGENHVFIDADYESLEPHVFAHVSGDENLRDIFRRGHDFYSTIAIRTEKLSGFSADKKAKNYLGELDPTRRQKAKTYALGIPYGMTAYKLKFEIGVSESEAQRLWNDYLNSFKSLEHWMIRSEEKCLQEGWIASEAGRVRHMPEAVEIYNKYGQCILNDLELWKEYHEKPISYEKAKADRKRLKNYLNNSKNFQIQSLSTSIVNRSAIAINRYMRNNNINGYVCAQIHDQLIVRVVAEYADLMCTKVQELMENTYKLSIDLKAPASIAPNWLEGH